MTLSLAAVAVGSAIVGISLGFFGGGGAILTVPLFTYIAGWPTHDAVVASLVIVGMSAVVGVAMRARDGHVRWGTGAVMGVAGAVGAFVGQWVGRILPGTVLMLVLAAVMLFAARAMIRGQKRASTPARPSVSRIGLVGSVVGVLTGLVGAGGGFLIVPALVAAAGLPMSQAVATSLLVILFNSASGLVSALPQAFGIDWGLTGIAAAIALAGTCAGSRWAKRLGTVKHKKMYGWFVGTVGVVIGMAEIARLVAA